LVGGQPFVLLGYPVEISEDMPAIAASSLPIAFGVFKKAYTIIRRLGVRFLVDPLPTNRTCVFTPIRAFAAV
jgi:HK97 family phage major capsid protein